VSTAPGSLLEFVIPAGTLGIQLAVLEIFGRMFVKRFTLCYQNVVLFVCPICNVSVLWPNGWMDQDETWHAGRPRPHCVRWRPSSPSTKGVQPPPI